LLKSERNQLTLVVFNTGNEAAVLRRLKLEPNPAPGSSLTCDAPTNPIFEPGRYQILNFTYKVDDVTTDFPWWDIKRSNSELILLIHPYDHEASELKCANWKDFK
jgi:hypothetical protein